MAYKKKTYKKKAKTSKKLVATIHRVLQHEEQMKFIDITLGSWGSPTAFTVANQAVKLSTNLASGVGYNQAIGYRVRLHRVVCDYMVINNAVAVDTPNVIRCGLIHVKTATSLVSVVNDIGSASNLLPYDYQGPSTELHAISDKIMSTVQTTSTEMRHGKIHRKLNISYLEEAISGAIIKGDMWFIYGCSSVAGAAPTLLGNMRIYYTNLL